jgi:alkylated DNA repair dioxygenase AlkB
VDDGLRIDRAAAVERHQLDIDSWVDVASGFVRDPEAAFSSIHESTAWLQAETLRYDHYVPEQRLSAALRTDSDDLLRQASLHLESRYRQRFDGVAAILYRDGRDFQGLHSDREMRWLDDTLIAIIVLGERRPFVIRQRQPWATVMAGKIPAGDAPDDLVLMPGEGDLLVMGGACQRGWMHGVPGVATERSRISLTWRWTSRRGRPDTNPTPRDGRQFGGAPIRPGTRYREPGR